MIAALKIRRDAGNGAFTCMSCDNLQGNGDILRQTVSSLARMGDSDLADWIESNCTFPNSMVDCIVPATGPNELALAQSLGIEDASPVTHESFRQWVIEDRFCAGRPEWDKVGATFTDRVHDYEAMKIRVLNGGHQIVANAGEVLSIATIAECLAHPQISAFFAKVAREEIVPHLTAVPGMAPIEYVELIKDRFSNPRIIDTTRRVAFDGSSRHPGFVIPSIKDGIARGTSVSGLGLAEAIWARMCAGQREDGSEIEANDPFWGDLNAVALQARSSPGLWLSQRKYYGDLANNRLFVEAFSGWLTMIWEHGVEAAMSRYLRDE
jgi:mannitol 2-dehydrogenase